MSEPVSVEQALELVAHAAGAPRARVERVPLDEALGRVLAADAAMDHDVPPFRRSAMDGFAVVAADARTGARLEVAGRVAAGEMAGTAVGPGRAVRIMTGAPTPPGTERVLPVEWTREDEASIRVERVPSDATHVIEAGDHLPCGAPVLRAGDLVTPGGISALATAGHAEVDVARAPTVAVLGTGSELVDVGAVPGPGQIRNSNSAMLRAQVRAHGGRVRDLPVAVDEEEALRALVRGGLDADVLVLSGGVSRGDLDLVPDALEAEGVRCHFHRWGVQPGGPLWFGSRGETLVFGLPGNPAASFVGFEILVVPALQPRLGRPFAPRQRVRARYEGPWGKAMARRRYRPARLRVDEDGVLVAEETGWRGSGDPTAAARARALVELPEDTPPPPDGRLVHVVPLEGIA